MTKIVGGKLSPGDARERLRGREGYALYEAAYKEGLNLSHFLNRELGYDKERKLDGFEQVLAQADLTVNTDEYEGIFANPCGDMLTDENRALMPEYIARQWRRVSMPQKRGTDIYMSADLNSLLAGNLTGAATTMWEPPFLEPAIPLSELVAVTTGITGTTTYEAMYLTEPNVSETRFVRIGETAEIPRAKLTAGKSSIRLNKFGRGLEISYEELRRMRIDRLGWHVRRMAVQAEIDKADAVTDVLINGDGNSNPATSTNISSLDAAATGGAITVLGWVSWKVGWNTGAYRLTAVLVRQVNAIKILMLNMGNANYPFNTVNNQIGIGSFRPMGNAQRTLDDVSYGVTETVGATMILGLDARQAIERVFEVGGSVEEVARFVTRQTQVLVMTEVEAYAKMNANAVRILNLA